MDRKQFTAENGHVRVEIQPFADLPAGHIRVEVEHSGVSTGTELLLLENSRNSSGSFAIGYQAAGIVTEVSADLADTFTAGDRVACYGAPYTGHASHLNVPRHLAAKLAPGVKTSHACFGGLSSIALHGFRQTGCSIGETVAVIGLGLLGNLAAQCARGAGCQVACCELLPARVSAAAAAGLEVIPTLDALHSRIHDLTDGHGADAVILAVKNADSTMLAEAYKLVRRLGKVVILGLSDGTVPRELMFAKEASMIVSRAAGWGRYNNDYEFGGQDFPYEHARWTEGRNLREVVRLMEIGALNIELLITDALAYDDCAKAYEMLQENPAEHLAVVINWNGERGGDRTLGQ